MFGRWKRKVNDLQLDLEWAKKNISKLQECVFDLKFAKEKSATAGSSYAYERCETLMELLTIISGYTEEELQLLLKAKRDGVDITELAARMKAKRS